MYYLLRFHLDGEEWLHSKVGLIWEFNWREPGSLKCPQK